MNFKSVISKIDMLSESADHSIKEDAGHSVLDIITKKELDRLCKMHNDGKDFTDDKALCDKFCKYYDLEPGKDKAKVKSKVMKDYGAEIKKHCKEIDSEKVDEGKEMPRESFSLKDIFNELSEELLSENNITMEPASQSTQVIKKNDEVVGTVDNPGLASQLKRGIESGDVSFDQEMNEEDLYESDDDLHDIARTFSMAIEDGFMSKDDILDIVDEDGKYDRKLLSKALDMYADAMNKVYPRSLNYRKGAEILKKAGLGESKVEKGIRENDSDDTLNGKEVDWDSITVRSHGGATDMDDFFTTLYLDSANYADGTPIEGEDLEKLESEIDLSNYAMDAYEYHYIDENENDVSEGGRPHYDSDFGAGLGAGRSRTTLEGKHSLDEGAKDYIHKKLAQMFAPWSRPNHWSLKARSMAKLAKFFRKMPEQKRRQAFERGLGAEYLAHLDNLLGPNFWETRQQDLFGNDQQDYEKFMRAHDRYMKIAKGKKPFSKEEDELNERAEKAGKKVAKDIKYDNKKSKKKKVSESTEECIQAAHLEGKSHGLKGHAHIGDSFDTPEKARAYHQGYKEGLDERFGMRDEMPAATMPGMDSQELRFAEEMDEGMMDKARGLNYKRLAQRSMDKAAGAMDKAMDYEFADLDNREEHEDEFMKQMDKRRQRAKKASELLGYNIDADDEFYEDEVFENWDRELKSLLENDADKLSPDSKKEERLDESLSVSISKGHQGTPDSVSITAQGDEAEELLQLSKKLSSGVFGDDKEVSDYGAPKADEIDKDHSEMMALMKAVEEPKSACHEEESENQMEFKVAEDEHEDFDEGAVYEKDHKVDNDDSLEEEEQMDETNAFIAARRDAIKKGHDSFEVDGKKYPVKGADDKEAEDINESSQGEYYADYDEDSGMWGVFHTDGVGSFDSSHCFATYADEESAEADAKQRNKKSVNEWANDAGRNGTDEAFEQDIEFMTKVISGGVNKQKKDQTTLPHTKVKIDEGKDTQDTETPQDWMKLAGIKK